VTGDLGITVSVEKKKSLQMLTPSETVPHKIDGVYTDVNQTGLITPFNDPKLRYRPAPGGVSIGHRDITAGTLGAWVRLLEGGRWVILSNNHVLANSNDANLNDPILQPGPHDGGVVGADTIATLYDFVEIDFGGGVPIPPIPPGGCDGFSFFTSLFGGKEEVKPQAANLVDAAIAIPVNDEDATEEILNIGEIMRDRLGDITLGSNIQKMGRTTEYTQDEVRQVDVTVNVSYGSAGTATFEDQIMAGAMSAGGDSGSVVLDMDRRIVGLLFAGSDTTTIINRAEHVFNALNITV
jgi:hypothetical protein